MRIQLKSDRGAVAVMVGLLTVFFVGLAAFSVDAGSGFVAKRQLSHAADAAALAGAAALIDAPSADNTCNDIKNDPAAVAAARDAADAYLTRNRANTTRTGFSVSCSSDGKSVDVFVADHGTVNGVLSGIFGINHLEANRQATAELGVPTSSPGLRPYAVCLTDLGDLQPSDPPMQFNMPEDQQHPECGQAPGNWYSLDCPPVHTNSNNVIGDNTMFGCDSDIHIIDTSSATTDTQRISILDTTCAGTASGGTANPGCLTANTGNLPNNVITQAFDYIMGLRDSNGTLLNPARAPLAIVLPVFFASQSTGQTSVIGTGENSIYPVYALVGASMCAYHFNNQTASTQLGKCAGAPALVPPPNANGNNWNAVQLVGRRVQLTGSTGSPTCSLGDNNCDFGARSVRLIK